MRKPKIDDDYVIELILNQKEDIEFLFDKF